MDKGQLISFLENLQTTEPYKELCAFLQTRADKFGISLNENPITCDADIYEQERQKGRYREMRVNQVDEFLAYLKEETERNKS